MKVFYFPFVCGILCLLSSCSKLVYTHQEAMNLLSTKEAVIRRFGLPTTKREEGGLTEWIYYFGSTSTGMAYNPYGTSMAIGRVDNYSQYAKFLIDSSGYVVRWSSQGVNLEKRIKQPGKTWALIIGAIAASVTAGVLIGNSE